MKAGDCFLAETGPIRGGAIVRHLFVLLIDPEPNTGNTVTVPSSTIRSPKCDQTCTLKPGEHDFIEDPSFIDYSFAEVESEDDILAMIKSRDASHKDPVTPELLERIQSGLTASKHTRRRVKEWFIQQRMDQLG